MNDRGLPPLRLKLSAFCLITVSHTLHTSHVLSGFVSGKITFSFSNANEEFERRVILIHYWVRE